MHVDMVDDVRRWMWAIAAFIVISAVNISCLVYLKCCLGETDNDNNATDGAEAKPEKAVPRTQA